MDAYKLSLQKEETLVTYNFTSDLNFTRKQTFSLVPNFGYLLVDF